MAAIISYKFSKKYVFKNTIKKMYIYFYSFFETPNRWNYILKLMIKNIFKYINITMPININ